MLNLFEILSLVTSLGVAILLIGVGILVSQIVYTSIATLVGGIIIIAAISYVLSQ